LKEVWSLDEWENSFEDTFSFLEVGNGMEIRFWEDKWVGNLNLKDTFPRLFTISSNKDLSVWQAGQMSQKLEWKWKIEWRRNMFEWERTQEH